MGRWGQVERVWHVPASRLRPTADAKSGYTPGGLYTGSSGDTVMSTSTPLDSTANFFSDTNQDNIYTCLDRIF